MSTLIGRQAEDLAAQYLSAKGHELLAQNWRNRWCEIDIVAKKARSIHFVEVKYRASSSHGSGLEYITPTKLKQMKYAALHWVSENQWEGDYQLDAIEVAGDSGAIKFVENVIIG